MNNCRLGLASVVLGLLAAAPANGETVGEVVQTNGVTCGWTDDEVRRTDDVGGRCGGMTFELREKSSIDRGMTVHTEEGCDPLACLMTLDEGVVDGQGAVIMRPMSTIRLSGKVLSNLEMVQIRGVVQIAWLPRRVRELKVHAGTAVIVFRGTYVEIRVDEATGLTTVGVIEGSVLVTGLVNPGAQAPPVLPDIPPEGAMRSRVYPGEQVTVTADGFISPPVPFPPGRASDPTIVIEDGGLPTEPGTAGPEGPRLPDQICDLPRGICG